MEYVYSAMLLHAAGKEITEDGIENILKAAGVDVDTTRVKALTASLEGIDIEEAIKAGISLPAAAAPPAAGDDKGKKAEEKPKKEEEEAATEEEAAAGLGALFG